MNPRGYTVLGWVVWKVARLFVKLKLGQNRTKLGAAGVVALVVAAGIAAAAADGDGD